MSKPENPSVSASYTLKEGNYEPHGGLSMLDYFAGQALLGYKAGGLTHSWRMDFLAEQCYNAAEAMLAERERRMK